MLAYGYRVRLFTGPKIYETIHLRLRVPYDDGSLLVEGRDRYPGKVESSKEWPRHELPLAALKHRAQTD